MVGSAGDETLQAIDRIVVKTVKLLQFFWRKNYDVLNEN